MDNEEYHQINNDEYKEVPSDITTAVEFMKKSFGGTDVEIVSGAYRLSPTKDAPAGALGRDLLIKIPDVEMTPVKLFLRNSIAEDIAFTNSGGAPQISQMIADEIVFECIRPEYNKLKEKFGL